MQASGKKNPACLSRSRGAGLWGALLSALMICLGGAVARAQTPPAVVVSQVSFVGALTGGYTSGNNGNPAGGSFAVDPNGDILVGGTYSGNVDVFDGVTNAATRLVGVGGGGVAIDSTGNLYVPQVYGSTISKIPFSNGYSTANKTTISPAGISSGIKASAFDAAGDLFLVTVPSQTDGSSKIYEITAANLSSASPATTLVYSDPLSVTSIAIDPSGNLFFVDDNFATIVSGLTSCGGACNTVALNLQYGVSSGSYLYELAGTLGGSYTGTPVLLKSLVPASPAAYDDVMSGLVADAHGTVYYTTQNDGVFAFANNGTPFTSGSLPTFYTVSTFSGKGLANDAKGNLYLITYNGGDGVYRMPLNNVVIPAGAVGVAASTTAGSATAAAATGQVQIAVNDGASPVLAITAYENGSAATEFTATVNAGTAAPVGTGTVFQATVTATATTVGERTALFKIQDTANNGSGTSAVVGTGNGAMVTLDPGTSTAYATGFTSPRSVSVDAAGDLFVTDSGKLYEIASGGNSPTAITSASFGTPSATALDAYGNLYIADATHNAVYEIAQGSTSVTTLISGSASFAGAGLNAPAALAVGPDDVLYIVDTGNNRVVSYNLISGLSGVSAFGLDTPTGVAVDGLGNLYVANNGAANPGVIEYSGGTVTTLLPTTVTAPWGVAVDASGSLLVSDAPSGNIVRIPYEAPRSGTAGLNSADAVTVEVNPKSAYGLALDALGNLYTTDAAGKAVYVIARTSATVNFGTVNSGSVASDLLYVESAGNLALTTPTISTAAASPFTLAAGGSAACGSGASATAVAVGTVCEFTVGYTAPVSGSSTGSAALTFTNAQIASANVALQGTGAPSSGVQNQVIVFAPLATPINFTSTPITLYAVATPSGLPVTFRVTGPASVTGNQLTLTGYGNVMVTASQSGSSSYAAATPVSYTIVVNSLGTTATPTFSPTSNTFTFVPQTISIADATPGAVIYYTTNGTTPTTSSAVYSTALSVTATETIQALAVAPGYAASGVASGTYTISVQPASVTLAITAAPLTVVSGQSGAVDVTVTPTNGFNSTVTLAVTGLPTGATGYFAPATLKLAGGASAMSVLTIATGGTTKTVSYSRPLFPGGAMLALAFCCFGWKKRNRVLQMFLLLAVGAFGLTTLSGCGSSSSAQPSPTTVTVTATAGSVTQSATFSLTVMPH